MMLRFSRKKLNHCGQFTTESCEERFKPELMYTYQERLGLNTPRALVPLPTSEMLVTKARLSPHSLN